MFAATSTGAAVNGWPRRFSISCKRTAERSPKWHLRRWLTRPIWANEHYQNHHPQVMAKVSSRSLYGWQAKNWAASREWRSWLGLLAGISHQESQAHEYQDGNREMGKALAHLQAPWIGESRREVRFLRQVSVGGRMWTSIRLRSCGALQGSREILVPGTRPSPDSCGVHGD